MANVGDLSVQLNADDQASRKIAAASQNMKKSFNVMKTGALMASAAIIAGFGASVKSYLDTGDAIHKMSQRLGMGATTLDAFGTFAGLAGQELSLFEMMIKMLNKQMILLSEGATVQTEAFKELGFSFESLAAMTKEERLVELLASLADVESMVDRDRLAFEAFGGASMKINNLLGDFNGQGLKDSIEGLKESAFWTDESALAAANFNDTMALIQRTIGNVAMELVDGHIPAMQEAASNVLVFVEDNKEAIIQSATLALTLAKVVIGIKLIAFALGVLKPILVASRMLWGFYTTQVVISGVAHSRFVHQSMGLVKFLMSPFRKAFTIAVGALKSFRIAALTAWLVGLGPWVAGIAILSAVLLGVVAIFFTFSKTLREAVQPAIDMVWNAVKALGEKLGVLKGAWESVVNSIKKVIGKAGEVATTLKEKVIPTFDTTAFAVKNAAIAMDDFTDGLTGISSIQSDANSLIEEYNDSLEIDEKKTKAVTVATVNLGNAMKALNMISAGKTDLSMTEMMESMPSLSDPQAQAEYNAALALMAGKRAVTGDFALPSIASLRKEHGAFEEGKQFGGGGANFVIPNTAASLNEANENFKIRAE